MRQKEPPRVLGPYKERNRWRLVVFNDNGRRSEYFESEADAQRQRRHLTKKLEHRATRKLADMIAEYTQEKIDSGRSLPKTAAGERQCLLDFFGSHLAEDISAVTPKHAALLYEQASTRISQKTGQPLAVASHRCYLEHAKTFCGWAVEKRYLPASPFQAVKPRGKPNRGKPQLRIEEAQRFIQTALTRWGSERTPITIAALTALYMGLRANEVLQRRARDLDAGGRILWIDFGKTHNARRHLKVPKPLQPLLRQLCQDKSTDDFLFGEAATGQPIRYQTLWREVRLLCEQAGAPTVCTHSLRGLYATLAVESGVVSDAVAASLGHGSFSMTERHYAAPTAVQNAKTARVVSLLDTVAELEEVGEGDEETVEAMRQRLQQLDRTTLARLIELADREGAGKAN